MQKPIIVARQDFISNLVNLINAAELPMFVVNDVLEDIQKEVQAKAQEQYKEAKEIYEKAIKSEEENENGSN